jgi:hypothetical protein
MYEGPLAGADLDAYPALKFVTNFFSSPARSQLMNLWHVNPLLDNGSVNDGRC